MPNSNQMENQNNGTGKAPASVPLHYNIPQLRGAIVRARMEILLAARRSGKTTGVIAERVSWNAFKLQRSLGGIIVPSHRKFLTEFIPSFVDGLESVGYVEERDYFIGRRGPKSWDLPFHRPKKFDHAMHWRCGSAEAFVSQHTGSAGAGLTLDRIVADEAKHLDGDQFEQETLAALSGHPSKFKDKSEHLSMLITSDRPYTSKGKWFFKYRDLMDPVVIQTIFQLQLEIQEYEQRLNSDRYTNSTRSSYRLHLSKLYSALNSLRSRATYWHEASTIDNIHAVGPQYIKLMADKMDLGPFQLSILNQDTTYVEGGFYPDLDDDLHGYHPSVSAYTSALGIDRSARQRLSTPDCRHDAELVTRLPLEIAMDYGNSFNCIAVGQLFNDTFRIDNGFHVYFPDKVRDVVNQFCDYYEYYQTKHVVYYYDQTAIGHDGKNDFAYYELVIDVLKSRGWSITPVYIGPQPEHHTRYEMWGSLLSDNGPFKVRFNLENCDDMLISMHSTRAKQSSTGFKKDKSGEKDRTLDQAHAPHYTDACDTLLIGRLRALGQETVLPTVSGYS